MWRVEIQNTEEPWDPDEGGVVAAAVLPAEPVPDGWTWADTLVLAMLALSVTGWRWARETL